MADKPDAVLFENRGGVSVLPTITLVRLLNDLEHYKSMSALWEKSSKFWRKAFYRDRLPEAEDGK